MKTFETAHGLSVPALAATLMVVVPACQQPTPTAERIVARVAAAMVDGGQIEDLETLRIRMVYADHE